MVTRRFSGLVLCVLLVFSVAFQACSDEEQVLQLNPAPVEFSEAGTEQVAKEPGIDESVTVDESVCRSEQNKQVVEGLTVESLHEATVESLHEETESLHEETESLHEENATVESLHEETETLHEEHATVESLPEENATVESLPEENATVESLPEENATVESLHEENATESSRDENNAIESDASAADASKEAAKPVRTTPLGLDEYKRKKVLETALAKREENFIMHHKRELGGEEYNFASASHGAKVVSTNKEAKGGGNVLSKDSDKYMRNPCSAEEKFLVVELSEEALVDTIVLENKELYSCNPKEFEVLGSLVYPTDEWKSLGKLEAENVRHSQRFDLPEPQWVKYLKVNLLTHYGSEFYCTLTALEVFGVDAIERLLEDWIGKIPQVNEAHQHEAASLCPSDSESVERKPVMEVIPEPYMQSTRSNIDSVIKLLMQKVKKMEHEQTVFDNYMEKLNLDYKNIFSEHEREIEALSQQFKESKRINDLLLESLQKLEQQREVLNREIDEHIKMELVTWTSVSQRLSRMADRELLAFSLALLTLIWTIASRCSPQTWLLTTLTLLVLVLSS